MQIIVPLTYSEIEDTHPAESELIGKLALLNRKKTVLFLAMVNLLISLYQNEQREFVEVQGSFVKNLITDEMLEKLRVKFATVQLGTRPLFHRQQVLALLKRSLTHCPEEGGLDLSSRDQGWIELGLSALMMSDIMDPEGQRLKLEHNEGDADSAKQAEEELVAQMLVGVELLNTPEIIKAFVRNTEYLKIFERQSLAGQLLFSDGKTLFDKFNDIARLNLFEYLRMIVTVALYYQYDLGGRKPAELINDPKLFNINATEFFSKMKFSVETIKAFFDLFALSIDSLAEKLRIQQESLGLPEKNDFTVLRRYPMIYTRDSQDIMTCLDSGFLAEKTVNGLYFTIHNSLKDKSHESKQDENDHKSFMGFWGQVFETYVNNRLRDARYGIELRDFYPAPNFTVPPEKKYPQAFDAVLDYKSKLVVMEHKGKFARLKPRYSGNREQLLAELKEVDIVGKAAEQLARNLGFIFNNQLEGDRHTFFVKEGRRKKTYDLRQIRRVRYIYPIIVHQDFFLRMNGVTFMARKLFEEELSKHPIDSRLVRPLTLITVEELERLVPYLKVKPLPKILEKYFLSGNAFDTFHNFFIKFLKQNNIKEKRNEWIDRRSDELWDEITRDFVDLSKS